MKAITSVEAQNRFGQLLDTVQREAVAITRHGRPTAFIVSPHDMAELLDGRRKRARAVAELEAWSQEAKARATSSSSALTDEYVNGLMHDLR